MSLTTIKIQFNTYIKIKTYIYLFDRVGDLLELSFHGGRLSAARIDRYECALV